jgi:hypothetical protein
MTVARNQRAALQRQRPVLDSVAHTRPRQQRRRRGESTLADGLLRVRHTAPHRDAAFGGTTKITNRGVRKSRNFGNRGHA